MLGLECIMCDHSTVMWTPVKKSDIEKDAIKSAINLRMEISSYLILSLMTW